MTLTNTSKVKEDVWVSTCCGQCYCMCGIKVRRKDGLLFAERLGLFNPMLVLDNSVAVATGRGLHPIEFRDD